MKGKEYFLIILIGITVSGSSDFANGQSSMTNIQGRNLTSLNGKWKIIIDPSDIGKGDWISIWKDKKPQGKTDFYEYSFDGAPELNVPGDFNSQLADLTYYESTVWYKKAFTYHKKTGNKLFIHFGAVNYKADVYINNKIAGSHEGGFTPFQFDITDFVTEGTNSIIVRTNNQRAKDGLPGSGFDWFNYGGITRDVNLVETPLSYIDDYFIQLEKGSVNKVKGWVKVNGEKKEQQVIIEIPELKIHYTVQTNANGLGVVEFSAPFRLWSPQQPKLYTVKIKTGLDSVNEDIGFRNIEVKGSEIILNGKPVFLKGVNIHEEIPQRKSRAYSSSDAMILLNWAKELGCNFVRLAHYPHNEYTLKLADRLGIMVWEEIPVYQGIDFGNENIETKMGTMLSEMIGRDKNRCATIIWSMSNETQPSKDRDHALIKLVQLCRSMDSGRLVTSAFSNVHYENNQAIFRDTVAAVMDVISINEYLGWYVKWPGVPGMVQWSVTFNKPLIMSEFGAEALYGNHEGPADVASSWSEEYQEQVYKDQLRMLKNIPFLKGICPWILADFRSPVRMHPVYQQGWNRKGLISDRGDKKKAWYVINSFYTHL